MNIYDARPFKTRNAEDFDLSVILDVFVNPLADMRSPFDYENSIIKGGMGSGKSIYLKANYAFYLYSIMPSLLAGQPVILPVLIRLSDFQHLRDPSDIYRAVIVQTIKEIARIYGDLASAERLLALHRGMQSLPHAIVNPSRLLGVLDGVLKMTSEEYKETFTKQQGASGSLQAKFVQLGTEFSQSAVREITQKHQPGISDVHDVYAKLLGDFNGSLLVLIDEAGSLDKTFFRGEEGSTSMFEVMMNQLRTAPYVRTKIAVYPHSYSDILVETRYGDMIPLTEDIIDQVGYVRFRERTIAIMDKYIGSASRGRLKAFDVFALNPSPTAVGDSIEQIIYASVGNVRRLLHILDQCMQEAYSTNKGVGKVQVEHVMSALTKHSAAAEKIYNGVDRDFMEMLAKVCRARSTHRFQFPYKAPVLAKYIGRSEEHNILRICAAGAGRRGTTYEFDYSFCIHHDIPTHYIKDTERIDKSRSRKTGAWIARVAQISEEVIAHAQIPGKIEGVIEYVSGENAFVKTDTGTQYFVSSGSIIDADKEKPIIQGRRIRFYPVTIEGSSLAYAVEVL